MSAKSAIEPVLRAVAARERRNLGEHLSAELLVAYRAGELVEADDEKIRDHLALCPECAEMLLDLVDFQESGASGEAPALSDRGVEAAWLRMQGPLKRTEKTPDEHLVGPNKGALPFTRRASEYDTVVLRHKLRKAYALAAVLAVGVVGLSFWGGTLRRTVRKLSEPKANASVAYLLSENDQTRGDNAEDVIAPGDEPFSLVLHPFLDKGAARFPEYGIRIVQASEPGLQVVKLRGLHAINEQEYKLRLPGTRFPPGRYRILFYGLDGERWRQLDTLTLSIASR